MSSGHNTPNMHWSSFMQCVLNYTSYMCCYWQSCMGCQFERIEINLIQIIIFLSVVFISYIIHILYKKFTIHHVCRGKWMRMKFIKWELKYDGFESRVLFLQDKMKSCQIKDCKQGGKPIPRFRSIYDFMCIGSICFLIELINFCQLSTSWLIQKFSNIKPLSCAGFNFFCSVSCVCRPIGPMW